MIVSALDSNLIEYLKDILVCPECYRKLNFDNELLACSSCGREFHFEDGIFMLQPLSSMPTPMFYNDKEYRKLVANRAKLHNEHYNKNSLSFKFEMRLKRDLMKLAVDPITPLVDIGCGTGSGFDVLGPRQNIIGIDRDINLLKKCKENYPKSTLICCDMSNAPFRNNSFLTMFSFCTLEHVFYLESFLQSVERILHPDGLFYVAVPTEGGAAWNLMRSIFTAPKYSKMFDLDYKKALSIEHCNTMFTIDNVLRKFFLIDRRRLFPWRIGGCHINLTACYRLRKRS